MLGTPPRLWGWLTREWCPLPAPLAWVLWRAVCKGQWSWAVEWREAFLVFARRCEGEPSRRMVAYFFTQHCAPADLVTLLEHLAKERVLVPRDARRIEELLLTQVHKDGLWKHQQGRRQPA